MNTKNNKRRRDSVEKIEKAFVELLQSRDIKEITVSEICTMTGLNRSTFYANFIDVYDLAEKVMKDLQREFSEVFLDYDYYNERTGAQRMFEHIKENQLFYRTYFKLEEICPSDWLPYDPQRAIDSFGDDKNLKYHIEFFRSGLNAIIKLWLNGGCLESPFEMAQIIKTEYQGRH